jgi:hypothetical protein
VSDRARYVKKVLRLYPVRKTWVANIARIVCVVLSQVPGGEIYIAAAMMLREVTVIGHRLCSEP